MKPAPFAYAAPDVVAEATELLARHGAEARVLAGGQTLGPMLNMRIVSPAVVVDINGVKDFDGIRNLTSSVLTGATVRQRDALESPDIAKKIPLLAAALHHVGHYQTRNRGTLCGSIAHADPCAELPLVLLTLGGKVHLVSARGRRTVAAADFFIGTLTTARRPDELIAAVEWPVLPDAAGDGFEEIGPRRSHFAMISCAVTVRVDPSGRVVALAIGLGGAADCPVLVDTWAYLGVAPDTTWRSAVMDHVRSFLRYPDDLHASGAYRRHVAGFLADRCLERALAAAGGSKGPPQ